VRGITFWFTILMTNYKQVFNMKTYKIFFGLLIVLVFSSCSYMANMGHYSDLQEVELELEGQPEFQILHTELKFMKGEKEHLVEVQKPSTWLTMMNILPDLANWDWVLQRVGAKTSLNLKYLGGEPLDVKITSIKVKEGTGRVMFRLKEATKYISVKPFQKNPANLEFDIQVFKKDWDYLESGKILWVDVELKSVRQGDTLDVQESFEWNLPEEQRELMKSYKKRKPFSALFNK
jgi:hypothetical protein